MNNPTAPNVDALIAENEAFKEGYQLAADATGYDGDWFEAAPIRELLNRITKLDDTVRAMSGYLEADVLQHVGFYEL